MMIYLQQLEQLAFFSGYPLVYALIAAIKSKKVNSTSITNKAFNLLPVVYAIDGILYVGLLLRNFYPNYSYEYLSSQIQIPFFVFWAVSSILFFIPWLRKITVLSLLHSLVFFYVIIKNYYIQLTAIETDKTVLKNYMNVYIDSLLLNSIILILLLLISYSINFIRRK